MKSTTDHRIIIAIDIVFTAVTLTKTILGKADSLATTI